ncbi:MAG: hypothetical protein BGO49_06000 [Planctomycetales bacterium 71-10]|nr:MAG: hypothetical protein BGO49_06000 [Planctomycetales bacterium 71-10]
MSTTTIERARPKSDERASASLLIPADVRLVVDADGFAKLCAANRDMRLELEPDGGLIVMTPAASDGGARNADLTMQLAAWNKSTRFGKAFDSSAGFTLPDGSVRAPDASWIRREVWDAVDRRERLRFARVVPDFAAEIRSPSDAIADVRAKMAAYIANGVRLGWLIDPWTKSVEIYRPGREPERLAAPVSVSGEGVLPGFTLVLAEIFED